MNEKDCTFYKSVLLRSVVGSHRYEEEQAKGRELSMSEDWVQFKMLYDKMELLHRSSGLATTNICWDWAFGDSIGVRDKNFNTSAWTS